MHLGHENKKTYPPPTEEDLAYLRKLMPVDMYLYEYAKQLFELRWQWYLNNVKLKGQGQANLNLDVKIPEVIQGCTSTQFDLHCPWCCRIVAGP